MIFHDFRNIIGTPRPGFSEILYNRIIRGKTALPWSDVWTDICTVNGFQGYFMDKIMFHYTPLISAFIERDSIAGVQTSIKFQPELFDSFYKFFADAIWVYVDRRDVFAQAVSMYLAEATQIWERHRGAQEAASAPPFEVRYNSEKLLRYLRTFLAEREQWQLFFRHYKIKPIRISYEEAVPGYPHYLKELLDKTGIQMVETPAPRRLLKIGDEVNEKWAEYLRNDVIADLYYRTHAGT